MTSDPERVVDALGLGEVVGIPTDTVYGLATLVTSDEGREQIFELKGRPLELALPVLVADLEQAEDFIGRSEQRLSTLARHFWPGALTVVVSHTLPAGAHLGGDRESVGLRCPADDVVRELCRRVGPLAVTSANRHGEAPISSPSQFALVFGDEVGVILDGGTRNGRPSSVVSIVATESRLLREGPIGWPEIVSALSVRQGS